MKLSRKWLSEFTTIDASSKEYAERMTVAGSKVELTEEPSEEINNVIVGRVTQMERHPDSDHMWICQVDVNAGEDIQIITGAQNVKVGDLVPVAMHRSLLPGGVKITKGKLRGLPSNGMLCSLKELGLDLHDFPYAIEDGIFILQEDCKPGDDIRPIIGADDIIVEFEITNNRPDCLSVIGLARESAATFDTELRLHTPEVKGCGGTVADYLDVEIENPELCPRYTGRVVKNIKIAPSPRWMRQRLRAMGVRPINNMVDITNYVMLEYGQPMHAFDYACIDGGKIVVRTARDGETMNTLDGNARELKSSMLVIADENKAVGIAGVMGGENSEITENTKMVVFESANFNGTSIRRTANALGMRTDASGRYEKGLDPMNTYPAIQRACELVEMLGAGEVVDGVIDVIASDKTPLTLKLETEKINKLLGTDISREFMVDVLVKLGFEIGGDIITVPSWRSDIEHYSDIAEEVARFYGYNKIEPTMFKGETAIGELGAKNVLERELGSVCRGLGYSEIMTYSFISPNAYNKICLTPDSPLRNSVKILNPLGEDSSVMRTTVLPSMMDILSGNMSHRNAYVKLYEFAKVYRPSENTLPDEPVYLSLGAYGGDMDFFDLKGAVETIFRALRISDISYEPCSDNPSYHPGRCAVIKHKDDVIGILGQVHPTVAANYGMSVQVYASQIAFSALMSLTTSDRTYHPLPRFPAMSRDIAVVCDEDIPVATLEKCIKKAGGKILKEVSLFDIYQGSHIAPGKKSAAFSLKFRHDDRTLTDTETDDDVKTILNALETELGAVLR